MSMVCWFFFFKQKTAYEMRVSDWGSDVCSSDLYRHAGRGLRRPARIGDAQHIVDARAERRRGVADRFGERQIGIVRRHAGEIEVGAYEIDIVGGRILIADLEPPGSRAALAVKRRQPCIGTEAVLIRR